MGMVLSENKSKAITILKDRRKKCLLLVPHSYSTNEGDIPVMGFWIRRNTWAWTLPGKGKKTPKTDWALRKDVARTYLGPVETISKAGSPENLFGPKATPQTGTGGGP